MNILIASKKNDILKILPFINISMFTIVASKISANELIKNNSVNYVLYEDSLNINKGLLSKKDINLLSFSNFINITSSKEVKSLKLKAKTRVTPVALAKPSIITDISVVSKDSKSTIENKVTNIKNNTVVNTKNSTFPSCCSDVNIYSFTSVKGGVGVSSIIKELAVINKEKIILDLAFINGGSDLSYYFQLPQVPHIGTYLRGSSLDINDSCIRINKDTVILQAPAVSRIYDKITKDDMVKILNACKGIALVDIPLNNEFSDLTFQQSKTIFIVTNGTPMEINRIEKSFNNYMNKIVCLVVNCKNKDFKVYCKECNLSYIFIVDIVNQLKDYL